MSEAKTQRNTGGKAGFQRQRTPPKGGRSTNGTVSKPGKKAKKTREHPAELKWIGDQSPSLRKRGTRKLLPRKCVSKYKTEKSVATRKVLGKRESWSFYPLPSKTS